MRKYLKNGVAVKCETIAERDSLLGAYEAEGVLWLAGNKATQFKDYLLPVFICYRDGRLSYSLSFEEEHLRADGVEVITCAEAFKDVDAQDVNNKKLEGEHIVRCAGCGRIIDEDELGDAVEFEGELYCSDCAEEEFSVCEHCGRIQRADSLLRVNGKNRVEEWWCRDCVDDDSFVCDECGERFDNRYYNSSYIDDTGEYICEDCWGSGGYHYCDLCDRCVSDAHWDYNCDCCNDCADDDCCGLIKDYHCAPAQVLIGKTKKSWRGKWRGLGVELEVDQNGDEYNEELAEALQEIAGEALYFEHDGSLNYGFEIITQPHTVEAFYAIDWARILKACVDHGFKSHDAGTCGLHIHISREMLGSTKQKQDLALAKLIQFYEIYWHDILKLSRRSEAQADRWASSYCTSDDKQALEIAKNRGALGRYRAINNCNDKTVEFRLCRGTLKLESFMAWVDFTLTIVKNAKRIKWRDVKKSTLWLRGLRPETIEHLKGLGVFGGAF